MKVERRRIPKRADERQALVGAGFTPLQCRECNAEFWCNDRWESFCAKCAGENEPPTIDATYQPKTHTQLMEAGFQYDQARRQVHARERQS